MHEITCFKNSSSTLYEPLTISPPPCSASLSSSSSSSSELSSSSLAVSPVCPANYTQIIGGSKYWKHNRNRRVKVLKMKYWNIMKKKSSQDPCLERFTLTLNAECPGFTIPGLDVKKFSLLWLVFYEASCEKWEEEKWEWFTAPSG